MPERPSRPRKRAMNVSIPCELAEEPKTYGTNVSAVLERALEAEHRERRRETWRKANRQSIREANEELAEHGRWPDGRRTF